MSVASTYVPGIRVGDFYIGGMNVREIKFRAWFKEESRMIKWEELHLETDQDGMFVWIGETDNFGTADGYPLEDFELMQYIGTDDKNGKAIYEGDIVDCLRNGDEQYIERVVINDIRNLPRALFGSSLISREVIGNIYENPWLLD